MNEKTINNNKLSDDSETQVDSLLSMILTNDKSAWGGNAEFCISFRELFELGLIVILKMGTFKVIPIDVILDGAIVLNVDDIKVDRDSLNKLNEPVFTHFSSLK